MLCMTKSQIDHLFEEQTHLPGLLEELIKNHNRREISKENLRPAAVLMPICCIGKEPHIILTKRSMHVEYHKGEISFPGGKMEEHDPDLIATALRESREEIDLHEDDVQVLGLLDDYTSLAGFHITPVVGIAPYPYDFRINAESDAMFFLPLRRVLSDDSWMEQVATFGDKSYSIYYLETDQGVVWGATAKILKQLADLLAGYKIPTGDLSQSAAHWVHKVTADQKIYRDKKSSMG